jgi:hypothetical protein
MTIDSTHWAPRDSRKTRYSGKQRRAERKLGGIVVFFAKGLDWDIKQHKGDKGMLWPSLKLK